MKDKKWLLVTGALAIGIIIIMYSGISMAGQAVLNPEREAVKWEGENRPFFLYAETDEDIQVMPWKEFDPQRARGLTEEEKKLLSMGNVPYRLIQLVEEDLADRGFFGRLEHDDSLSLMQAMELSSGQVFFFFQDTLEANRIMNMDTAANDSEDGTSEGEKEETFSVRLVLSETGQLLEYECLQRSGREEGRYEENKKLFLEKMEKEVAAWVFLGRQAEEIFEMDLMKGRNLSWDILLPLRNQFREGLVYDGEWNQYGALHIQEEKEALEKMGFSEGQVLELEDHLLFIPYGSARV